VFCDPPYGQDLGERALQAAAEGGWLAPGAIAVLEEREDAEIAWPPGFSEIDRRRYGDTQIAIARIDSIPPDLEENPAPGLLRKPTSPRGGG
jgi:16S rRNA (guanine966-N2)-methyltransferase